MEEEELLIDNYSGVGTLGTDDVDSYFGVVEVVGVDSCLVVQLMGRSSYLEESDDFLVGFYVRMLDKELMLVLMG